MIGEAAKKMPDPPKQQYPQVEWRAMTGMRDRLIHGYLNKGIFKELQDPSYFKQVRPAFGGVIWPHEQDFSADTIEVEMRELESANA